MVTQTLESFRTKISHKYEHLVTKIRKHKTLFTTLVFCSLASFVYFKPQQFSDLWLTRDQQGALLFHFEKYDLASKTFNNTKWQAYSLYGDEKFDQSALLFAQFTSLNEQLAHANALAQGTRYINARNAYQAILSNDPSNEAALHNIKIVQTIIDDINRMSESQKAEQGDSPKDLDDKPQRADGAKKQEARKREIEQLNAEQLLLDPSLNQMWLRQVQKDPAQFLSRKFYMQKQVSENKEKSAGQNNDE